MRASLSTRVFLGLALVVATFGVASFYAGAAVISLRHELRVLRDRALPLRDALRRDAIELEAFDEALGRAAPHDLDWLARLVPNARPWRRVDATLGRIRTLREGSRPPQITELLGLATPPLPSLSDALVELRAGRGLAERMRDDRALQAALAGPWRATEDVQVFDALVAGMQRAVSERRLSDASRVAVELRRLIRHVHSGLEDVERTLDAALDKRAARAARSEQRVIAVVIGSATLSLLVAILVLVLLLRTLRPMQALADVVRRFGGGDRQVRAETRGAAREIQELAEEYNRMADSLAAREAELSVQRDELARAERLAALGQLAARMTHEVRNPLSSIGLNAELLDEEIRKPTGPDADEASELLGSIVGEVERLRGITEGYLARARPAPSERERHDLGQLTAAFVDFARGELERRQIDVDVHAPPGVAIECDAGQIRQALWNLTRNAWEAMPNGGVLRFEVARAQGEDGQPRALLAVEDTGDGIAADVRERIFEPFFTTKDRGTGVGLALVREVASSHDGTVAIEDAQDGGARLVLRLPCA